MNNHLEFVTYFLPKSHKEEILFLYKAYYRLLGILRKINEPIIRQIRLAWLREMLLKKEQTPNLEEWMQELYQWCKKTPQNEQSILDLLNSLEEDFIYSNLDLETNSQKILENILTRLCNDNRYIEIEKIFRKSENSFINRLKNIIYAYWYYLKP